MESDSDSDGSYVSATPPRNSKRPQPPQSPPRQSPPPPPVLLSSHKSKIRVKASSSASKPKKPPPKTAANTTSKPSGDESPPSLSPCSAFPFQICPPSVQNRQMLASHSIETLPPGYFLKSAFFSKIQRSSLTFESTETVRREPVPAETGSSSGIDSGSSPADGLPVVKKPNSVNKKHPNLIGADAPFTTVKFRKSDGREGNFVKLNMNRKKKFKSRKGNSKSSSAWSSQRPYRGRNKRKSAAEVETEKEEDGLVAKIMQEKKPRKNNELIEEAVLAARNQASDENLVRLLNVMYGYESFREGQLEAIKMVLDGRSAMLVLPTGSGKTLCYQIPAVILPGITLVVSPLVALMFDQLKQLPPMIQGGVLSSIQAPQEVSDTLRLLREGSIKVLFVSPERLLNEEFLSTFSSTPMISLLVVDEAHCISEWSHNFRPSYLRLRASLLRARLKVGCILAMTATATTTTLNAIMSALEIPSTNLIQKSQLRENLQLSVSFSRNRMKDLLMLIKSPPFAEVQSIIIYCKFQSETDLISRYLCDNNISAKSYHSAMYSKERSRTQELFCSNKIRVVVATVAFGMGLDKGDVGAIIHYSLPESLEEYVQEIGRSGRDGRLSYCHLFVDDITYFKLRSFMYSDGVDEYAVNKFLARVFSNGVSSCGKICSIVKESASHKFDIKEEVMHTLLTQLELGEVQYLRLIPQMNITCTLNFYKTSPFLLAEKDIVVSEVLKKSEVKHGQYVFDMPAIANGLSVTPFDLTNWLENLKLKGEITYEVKDLAYCYSIVEVPEDFCSLSACLSKWLSEVERCKVQKLDAMFNAAVSAVKECEKMQECHSVQQTLFLQKKISDYFREDYEYNIPSELSQSSPFLRADIKVFLQSNSNAKFTPRAIARIMHGIGSPAYPSINWSKTHFWGRYMHVDFKVLMEAAKAELMNVVGKDVL